MSKLPLEGIRVIELTTGAAGPTVARVLCEFGAEVIRCETRLRGDGHRGRGAVASAASSSGGGAITTARA